MVQRTTGTKPGRTRGTASRKVRVSPRAGGASTTTAGRAVADSPSLTNHEASDGPRPSLTDRVTAHFAGDTTGIDGIRRAVDGRSLSDVIREFAFEADVLRPLTIDFPDLLPSIGTVMVRADAPDDFRQSPTRLLDAWNSARWMYYHDLYTHKERSPSTLHKLDEIMRMASERIDTLFYLLATELVAADGVNPQSNERKPIEGRTWKRDKLAFKLGNGDLMDHGIGGALWLDVVLRAPQRRASPIAAMEIGSPRGRKERIAYLAALSHLFEQGYLETTASSGGELTRQIESALESLGYDPPSESQVRRRLNENLKGLWNRATGGG